MNKHNIIVEAWKSYFGDSVKIENCMKYNSLETREQLALMNNTYEETLAKVREKIMSLSQWHIGSDYEGQAVKDFVKELLKEVETSDGGAGVIRCSATHESTVRGDKEKGGKR